MIFHSLTQTQTKAKQMAKQTKQNPSQARCFIEGDGWKLEAQNLKALSEALAIFRGMQPPINESRKNPSKAREEIARRALRARAQALRDVGSKAAASANEDAKREAKRIRERERMRAKRAAARALKETSKPSQK